MTTETDAQIQEIDMSIEQANRMVSLRDSLIALQGNKHFKAIFEDDYFKETACRLVRLKADPGCQEDGIQKAILRDLDAIGCMQQHLNQIIVMGNTAERTIASDEETREAILAEDLASGDA